MNGRFPDAARFVWAGVRWRLPLSAALLVCAVVTAAAAALGPLYARSAAESTLRDELTQAAVQQSGLVLQASYRLGSNAEEELSLAQVDRSLAAAPRAGSIVGYPSRIESVTAATYAAAAGVASLRTQLVWRQGACAHLRFTAGRCPAASGEAAVSARTVAFTPYGWKLGDRLALSAGGSVRIVGVYTPANATAPYWFDDDLFDAAASASGADSVDSVFVTRDTFAGLAGSAPLRAAVEYELDPSHIRLANLPRLSAEVRAMQRRFSNGSTFVAETGLRTVLAAAAGQRALVDVGAGVVTAQSTLLGWLVLFLVLIDAVDTRGAEIALAKLRGLPPGAIWRFALVEPLLVILVAMPVGLGLGSLTAVVFAANVLVPGTPVALVPAAFLAIGGSFLGGVVAAVVAARRVVTRSVLAQWRRTDERPKHARGVLLAEAGVSIASVAALVVLRVMPGRAAGIELLAPGLLVVSVALLGSRLIPLAARRLILPTRSSRHLGLFLAVRQVGRRPAGLRLVSLLTLTVGLASFGVAAENVATTNRTTRAEGELGASTTVSIQYGRTDPVAAVRRVDPNGRWAMTAATWLPDGGGTVNGTVLAVDSPSFADVAEPARGGLPTEAIARILRAGTVPVITVRATAARAVIAANDVRAADAPVVQFNFTSADGRSVDVNTAPLHNGVHDYAADVPCSAGCTFVGLTWYRPVTVAGTMAGTATLTRLDVRRGAGAWTGSGARSTDARAWRAGPSVSGATDRVHVSSAGVSDRFSASNGGYGGIAYASVPDPIPLVATRSAIVLDAGTPPSIVDGEGVTAAVRVARYSAVLPSVLDYGAIGDLNAVRSQLPGFDDEARWQVWLSANAPVNAIRRLRSAGLDIDSVQTVHEREQFLARQAPALSLLLLLIVSFAGAILAMGASTVAITASARRRSYETAALRVLRVRGPALFSAAVIEQALLLGGAVVLGIPAGVIAALVVLPVLPEFATNTPIALQYVPSAPPLLLFAALFAALVAATALIAAGRVVQQARPSRLREGEE